jgi:hypothetical protein
MLQNPISNNCENGNGHAPFSKYLSLRENHTDDHACPRLHGGIYERGSKFDVLLNFGKRRILAIKDPGAMQILAFAWGFHEH